MVSVYNLNGLIERLAQAETILSAFHSIADRVLWNSNQITLKYILYYTPYYTPCIASLDALTALAA